MNEATIVRALLAERSKLLAYIWLIVRDAALVEDVYQEVAVLTIEKRSELRDEFALPTWLRRTARFQALAALRDRSRERLQPLTEEVLDELDAYWSTQDEVSDDQRTQFLADCVQKLSPYAREVIAMRYGEKMSGEEVARKLGRKIRTIYMVLTRIHSMLRNCIETKLSVEPQRHV